MENGNDKFIEVVYGKDIVQVEDDFVRQFQLEFLSSIKCKYKDCVEIMKNEGEYCLKYFEVKVVDEDVFRKFSLFFFLFKFWRFIIKIFSLRSILRIVYFFKFLENILAFLLVLKNKLNGV